MVITQRQAGLLHVSAINKTLLKGTASIAHQIPLFSWKYTITFFSLFVVAELKKKKNADSLIHATQRR